MKFYPIIIIFLAISLITCSNKSKDNENRTKVRLETSKGEIIVALYNETPLHRDNFIKLTRERYFDGTLFHRVINDFMIQGGDPNSKHASKGEALGNGDPGYTVPAEIQKNLIHKKGALAAARQGNRTNPKRASSGSQFYLVEGKVYSLETLKNIEKSKNAPLRKSLIKELKAENKSEIDSLITLRKQTNDTISLNNFIKKLNNKIDKKVNEEGFHFTDKQIEAYTTVGGVPHLDNEYTVFGEIIEGIEVVEKISDVEVDKRNRPLEDVIILRASIVK